MKNFVPPLRARLDGSIKLHLKNAIAEADQVVIEAEGESRTKEGRDYNNLYCIVLKLRTGRSPRYASTWHRAHEGDLRVMAPSSHPPLSVGLSGRQGARGLRGHRPAGLVRVDAAQPAPGVDDIDVPRRRRYAALRAPERKNGTTPLRPADDVNREQVRGQRAVLFLVTSPAEPVVGRAGGSDDPARARTGRAARDADPPANAIATAWSLPSAMMRIVSSVRYGDLALHES